MRRRRIFCEFRIARAAVSTAAKSVQLSIDEQDVGRLGNNNILAGELLLQPHRAAIRPHAHRPRGIKAHQRILGTVTNGDRLNLQKRRVNRYRRPVFNREMNRACVQCQSELIANSEDGEVSRPANANGAAVGKIKPCSPRFDDHVAAAPQDRSGKAMRNVDAHGTGNRHGRPINNSNRVRHRFIRARRHCRQDSRTCYHHHGCNQPKGNVSTSVI